MTTQDRSSRCRAARDMLGSPGLRSLTERMAIHGRLLEQVRQRLPSELAAHCLDCALRDGQLILYTDGQAWSFRLRFHIPALLADLMAATGGEVRAVRIRVMEAPPRSATRGVARPSVVTAALVEKLGAAAASTELNAALGRLAHTLRRLAEGG